MLEMIDTGKPVDLTGQRFGMLTVLGVSKDVYIDPKRGSHYKKWDCKCDCGRIISVRTSALTCGGNSRGHTRSCGCERMQHMLETRIIHGESKTRIYKIWIGIKKRCYNKNCKSYENYGGRGIRVCEEWENDYEAFKKWSLENGYNDLLTVDRVNVDGDYSPENCRWVNHHVQANNTRSNRLITFNGKTQTLSDWASEYNINYSTLFSRLYRGWSIEESLLTPIGEYVAGQRKKVIADGIYA